MLTTCGPSQSGKTYWVYILFTKKLLIPHHKPLYDKINCRFIDCNKGFPVDCNKGLFFLRVAYRRICLSIVILDDLMTVATSSKENMANLDNFACRDAHHSNMSIVFTCQNLNYGNQACHCKNYRCAMLSTPLVGLGVQCFSGHGK